MQITISGRHMDVNEGRRTYATDKAEKLSKYYDRLMSVDVVFDVEAGKPNVEIIARADHHTSFVAKHQDSDPYATLDHVVKELESQLRKHKEKFRNRKHPG